MYIMIQYRFNMVLTGQSAQSTLSNSKYLRTSIELVCLNNIIVVNLVASQFLYFISIIAILYYSHY